MTMRLKIQEERGEVEAIGIEKGIVKGRAEGIFLNMASLVRDGLIDLATVAGRMNMTVDDFRAATASLR